MQHRLVWRRLPQSFTFVRVNIKSLRLIIAFLVFSITGCSSLPNLDLVKVKYRAYHDSGRYEHEIHEVAKKAIQYAEYRTKNGNANCAVVLDIDDTALSDWNYIIGIDFGYEKEHYKSWMNQADAQPVTQILELYKAVRKLGLPVFFISGRREATREPTETNLKRMGYTAWQQVFLRPNNDNHKTVASFKIDIRRSIEQQGYRIIVNVGDQESDLLGGYSEKTFKLPNPFYISK